MNSTDTATIFQDNQLKLKRLTRRGQRIIQAIVGEFGRPLAACWILVMQYRHLIDAAGDRSGP